MAVPKKKVTRSRRDMRRHSVAYDLDTITFGKCKFTGEMARPHTVSRKWLLNQTVTADTLNKTK